MENKIIILIVLSLFLVGCSFNGEYDDRYLNETDEISELDEFESDSFNYSVEKIVDLTYPWGMSFINDDLILVTEKTISNLNLINTSDFSVNLIDGIPEIHHTGQGGLLDVEFDSVSDYVYITYTVINNQSESSVSLGRGILNLDDYSLDDFEVIYTAKPYVESGAHFGSRVTLDGDGYVYMTVGDRGSKDFSESHPSQNLSNDLGSTLRFYENGSIPNDNPFVNDSKYSDAVYSYGHRNSQGMVLNPYTNEIWQSEHGERDGDEINAIVKGGNYGWPLYHYGCEYGTENPVGNMPHENDDIVDPLYYWNCTSGGFPPSGMTFYTSDRFEEITGDLFVSNLAGRYLGHFKVDNNSVQEVEPLLSDYEYRIRDVIESPDGYLYVITDEGDDYMMRLSID